ncbi:MAG: MATE family efflux transporter [Lachnospiraceae bacterium]
MKNNRTWLSRLEGRFYDASKIDWEHLPFSDRDLKALLIPLMLEQLLSSLMGMADTMMVSRVGSAAISAVSLADSINVLVIELFSALAAGGTILCSQYIGSGRPKEANKAAEQVTLVCAVSSVALALVCFFARGPLLALVFGEVEPDVMENSLTYFALTSLSFPFIALYNAGAAFYRAGGNSKFPMQVSVFSNCLNIFGNAVFIFGFGWGVFGAALSTLLSRIVCAAVVFAFLRLPKQVIVLRRYAVRPDLPMVAKILAVGVPSGIENSMFQFGKLAIQSSVSTLGTTAIAAQAMAAIMETVNGVGAVGIGIGLMTVVGQCIGAGKPEEAKYYIIRHMEISEVVLIASCLLVYAITGPVTAIAGMEPESAALCRYMVGWITVFKPLFWVFSFSIAYGMRAAGDVRFSMITSSCTMWLCRVLLTTILIRVLHFGPIAVWIGMFSDWGVRGIIFSARFLSGKWLSHALIGVKKNS